MKNEELFIKFSKERTEENRNAIVLQYIKLANLLTKKFLNKGCEYEDIFQVSCLALVQSVERYDIEKGVEFITFATRTILGEIKRFLRDKTTIVRIPRSIYKDSKMVSNLQSELSQKLNKNISENDIIENSNIGKKQLLANTYVNNIYNYQSLDGYKYDDDSGEGYEFYGAEDLFFNKVENSDFLQKVFNELSSDEKEFIIERFYKNKTQREISQKLNVSQMQISRYERKILNKFRCAAVA